jgi:hypothetical protein
VALGVVETHGQVILLEGLAEVFILALDQGYLDQLRGESQTQTLAIVSLGPLDLLALRDQGVQLVQRGAQEILEETLRGWAIISPVAQVEMRAQAETQALGVEVDQEGVEVIHLIQAVLDKVELEEPVVVQALKVELVQVPALVNLGDQALVVFIQSAIGHF